MQANSSYKASTTTFSTIANVGNNSSNICVQPKLNINKNHPLSDNQTKRNDVHYLLKQLNSFSDIEEIEIVEYKRYQQIDRQKQIQDDYDKHHLQSCHNTTTTTTTQTLDSESGFATTITTAIAGSSSSNINNRPRHSTCSMHGTNVVYSTTSRMSGDVVHTHLENVNNLPVSTSYNSNSNNSTLGGGETSTKTSFFKCCYTSLDKWRERRSGGSGGGSGGASGSGKGGGSSSHHHSTGGGGGDAV